MIATIWSMFHAFFFRRSYPMWDMNREKGIMVTPFSKLLRNFVSHRRPVFRVRFKGHNKHVVLLGIYFGVGMFGNLCNGIFIDFLSKRGFNITIRTSDFTETIIGVWYGHKFALDRKGTWKLWLNSGHLVALVQLYVEQIYPEMYMDYECEHNGRFITYRGGVGPCGDYYDEAKFLGCFLGQRV